MFIKFNILLDFNIVFQRLHIEYNSRSYNNKILRTYNESYFDVAKLSSILFFTNVLIY